MPHLFALYMRCGRTGAAVADLLPNCLAQRSRNSLLIIRRASCILLHEPGETGRVAFIWDLEDDPDGNYWHICVEGHGVTREEVEEVVEGNYEPATRSRASGQPEAFG